MKTNEVQTIQKRTDFPAIQRVASTVWNPVELTKPELDPAVLTHPPLTRSLEIIANHILTIEYAISPGGRLRNWIRFNIMLTLFVLVSVLILVPAAVIIFSGINMIFVSLIPVLKNMIIAGLLLSAFGAMAYAMYSGFRYLWVRKKQPDAKPDDNLKTEDELKDDPFRNIDNDLMNEVHDDY